MAQAVLVIHGAGEPRQRDGEVYWKALLAHGLGPEFDVVAPRMPEPDDPRMRMRLLVGATRSRALRS